MPRHDPARDELFLKTLEDLHRRVDDGSSNYDVLMASALIRKLLLDGGSSLVHQVNRSRQLRIVYCFMELLSAADHPIPGVPPPNTLALGFAFDGLEGAPEVMYMHRVVGKESQMLGATVMYVDGTRVSAREVVLHAAHVAGGVHAGGPNEKSAEIESLNASMQMYLRDLAGSIDPETADRDLLAAVHLLARWAQIPNGLGTVRAIGRVAYQALLPLALRVANDLEASGQLAPMEFQLHIPKGAAAFYPELRKLAESAGFSFTDGTPPAS